jgi:hypothetical protein
MVFKILKFFWNWRFEETGSTLLFLSVWETGYAEAHTGPFTKEDSNIFYSAEFASRSSDPPKVFWEEGRLNKSS